MSATLSVVEEAYTWNGIVAFSDLVSVLWARNKIKKYDAAIRIEKPGNELALTCSFPLSAVRIQSIHLGTGRHLFYRLRFVLNALKWLLRLRTSQSRTAKEGERPSFAMPEASS